MGESKKEAPRRTSETPAGGGTQSDRPNDASVFLRVAENLMQWIENARLHVRF